MQFQFAHYNYNVLNLEKSLAFYKEALGLEEQAAKKRRTAVLFWCISPMALPVLIWN